MPANNDPYPVTIAYKARGVHSGVRMESTHTPQLDSVNPDFRDYGKQLKGCMNPAQEHALEVLYVAQITGGEM